MEEPFEKEWEAEMMKLPKIELVRLFREAKTGTKDEKMCRINTVREANNTCEGIINDFEAGISTKEETMALLGEYTGRIMGIFWENALKKIKENPELLNR